MSEQKEQNGLVRADMDNAAERHVVLEQFPALAKMHQQATGFDEHKKDWADFKPFVSPLATVQVEDPLTLVLQQNPKMPSVSADYQMTDHAWMQLSSRLGPVVYGKGSHRTAAPKAWWIANADHKQTLVRSTFATYTNALIDKYEGDWFLRCYHGQMRAILTHRYAIYDNRDMIETAALAADLQRQNGVTGITFPRTYIHPDKMILDMLLTTRDAGDNGGSESFGIGARLKNDEIGSGAAYVLPLVQRNSCTNSIGLSGQRFRFVHLGYKANMVERVSEAIGNALMMSYQMVALMVSARKVELPNLHQLITKLDKEQGWQEEFADTVRVGTEGHDSLYGLVNGVTFAAQTIDDPDVRTEMEELGGALLTQPSRFFHEQWARDADYQELTR